ncbi:SPOR domain-containing protein [Leeia oryzae]|uniref:SPOR domain-containing protein n=1 Tax=Leeia oryzae TaxID=356662 RepID=UPI00036BC86A|nr:SPOR domain-containing protein [Leeia oryzae]
MSRDHKNSPRVKPGGNAGNKQGGGGLFTGIVIGLILGVIISVGVVYFVNKKMMLSPTPGLKQPEPTASALPKPNANGVSNGDAPEDVPASGTKGKYDFFDILPGTDAPAKPADKAAPAPADNPAPAKADKTDARTDQPAADKPADVRPAKSIFQVGSFQNETDADNLKAKLAILGVEATVRSKDIAGKGLWHRVMVGPFNTPEEADKVKALLQQNGINPSVINLK